MMNLKNNFHNMNYRVAAYERLSKEDDRVDESSSIESQKMIIESFANYEGLKILKHYSDDGWSGSNFNRPNFEKLIQDIEDGLINCVIVKDLSRLGRELYETGSYIEEYFLSKRVRFIAINDGYDSKVGDSMLGIRLSVNDLYLRDTSKKIRSSFDAKRKKGLYIGSYAKFGYLKNKDNPKELIKDSYAAPIVAEMFEMIASGMGSTAVAHELTNRGIPIPSVYKKENRPYMNKELGSGKGIWRPQTVLGIVSDEMYLGNMVQGRWRKVSYNSKKLIETPKSEWIVVKNTHEPIVSQELFDKVQRELEKKKKYRAKGKQKQLLQGLMYCKECGHTIGISYKKLKNGYSKWTTCNLFSKYYRYDLCSPHRLNYTYLEEDVLCFLRKIGEKFFEVCEKEDILKESVKIEQKQLYQLEQESEKIEKEMVKHQNILTKLYEDRLNGVINTRQYTMMSKKYDEKLLDLEKKNVEITEMIEKIKASDNNRSFDECKVLLEKFMKFEYPTRELMNELIEKIEIDKNMNVEIFLNIDVKKYVDIKELQEEVKVK